MEAGDEADRTLHGRNVGSGQPGRASPGDQQLRQDLRLWDASSGKELGRVDSGFPAWALGFSPDGRFLVSADDRTTLSSCGTPTPSSTGTLRGHTDDLQDLAFGRDGEVVTASWDGTAKIWDAESGRELATLRGHTGAVMGVAVSPDGRSLSPAASMAPPRSGSRHRAEPADAVRPRRPHPLGGVQPRRSFRGDRERRRDGRLASPSDRRAQGAGQHARHPIPHGRGAASTSTGSARQGSRRLSRLLALYLYDCSYRSP